VLLGQYAGSQDAGEVQPLVLDKLDLGIHVEKSDEVRHVQQSVSSRRGKCKTSQAKCSCADHSIVASINSNVFWLIAVLVALELYSATFTEPRDLHPITHRYFSADVRHIGWVRHTTIPWFSLSQPTPVYSEHFITPAGHPCDSFRQDCAIIVSGKL
jgi:hypothetical protein